MKIKKAFSESYNKRDLNNSFLSIDNELGKTNKVVYEIKEAFEREKTSLVRTMLDTVYPVGVTYVQYTDDNGNFLTKKEPSNLFKGTKWVERFVGDSVFFRTSGSAAEKERSENGIQKDKTKKEEKTITHSHALNPTLFSHSHTSGVVDIDGGGLQDARLFAVNGNLSGRDYVTLMKSGQMWGYEPTWLQSNTWTPTAQNGTEFIFTEEASQALTFGDGEETRPKNRLIKIWERVE